MAVVTGYKHIFMRLMWEKGRERNNSLCLVIILKTAWLMIVYTELENKETACLENNNLKGCTSVWVPWEIDAGEMIEIQGA